MSEAAEKLKARLMELPENERLEIADFLYDSVGSPEFEAVLQRRLEELATGKVVGVTAEELMGRLREKYAN